MCGRLAFLYVNPNDEASSDLYPKVGLISCVSKVGEAISIDFYNWENRAWSTFPFTLLF